MILKIAFSIFIFPSQVFYALSVDYQYNKKNIKKSKIIIKINKFGIPY